MSLSPSLPSKTQYKEKINLKVVKEKTLQLSIVEETKSNNMQ